MTAIAFTRYIIFFIFASLLACQCAVAVWDLSGGLGGPVDAFLIFTGASGILVIFTILLIDIAREDALFSQVWFELCWLTLYFAFEISGAAALSTRSSHALCSDPKTGSPSGCASMSALVGVSWTLMAIIGVYTLVMLISALLHSLRNPQVWTSGVRDFAWFTNWGLRERIRSAPNSPVKGLFVRHHKTNDQRPPSLVHPKPRLAKQPPAWASGDVLRTAYNIEHYAVDNLNEYAAQEQAHLRQPVAAPPPIHQMRAMRQAVPPSLYSPQVQSTIPIRQPLASTITRSSNNGGSSHSSILPYNPPPSSQNPLPSSNAVPTSTPASQRSTRARQPSGPRNRPPPLDLSKVSAYRQQ